MSDSSQEEKVTSDLYAMPSLPSSNMCICCEFVEQRYAILFLMKMLSRDEIRIETAYIFKNHALNYINNSSCNTNFSLRTL